MPTTLEWFLKRKRTDILLDTVTISHSSFTKVYYLVRNSGRGGVDLTLENSETKHFDYYPLAVTEKEDTANLDSGFQLDFGDLGSVLPRELDAVFADDNLEEKPQVIFRAYDNADHSAPLYGPFVLEAPSLSFNWEGCSMEAMAPYMNNTTCGESYNVTRFFTLRGYLK